MGWFDFPREEEKGPQEATEGRSEALEASPVVSSRQLSEAAKWALNNRDAAKYDQDGNPVELSHWFGHDR